MSAWQFLQQNWPELFRLIREHLELVLLSTGIAVIIGIPTGVLLTRNKKLQSPVLGVANVMQTIPSLALFGFLIPLPFIGGIGQRTAVVALVLYALLPIIRNTVTGILGVEPTIREAAVAMGMTDRQILAQVELPLAMSVILTGVRVATVIAVGVTTIAAAVGAGGLGVYIFRGLRQYDNNLLLAGAVSAALMALAMDFSLGVFEQYFSVSARRKPRISLFQKLAVVFIALALIAVVALSWQEPGNNSASTSTQRIVVGSKDFTESILLGEIVAQMLESRGQQVERQFELGGNLPHEALVSGRIDIYPEYTGTSYTAIFHHQPISDPRAVYEQLKKDYSELGVDVSPPLGFENTFAILIRGADARRFGLHTISEAVPQARKWRAGFGQDFMTRADGYPGLAKAYGLEFAERPREMDLSLTYIALASGKVDLIAGNSTEGRIASLDLFQLADDKHYFPPYEAVYLVRNDTLQRTQALNEVLNKLAGTISTEDMRVLNYEVDGNKRNPRDVVRQWIQQKKI
ncbi:MAG TPA: ABC transporter permease/substrate-binding protein [Pyrinomonadaceae bacterium]|nr:ABC transporter permease/substrate-binding protein [Pyrinomonadaceae bacterium]